MKYKTTVPSQDLWERNEFLRARFAQFNAHQNGDPPSFRGNIIVIEPDDDIVCDTCNDEILEPMVHVVEFGMRVACQKCWEKWYRNEIVKHRVLRSDGSLGGYDPE